MMEGKSLREQGNNFFKQKDYIKAIEAYSEGILLTTDKNELLLLYSNRAQCYLNINYPIYALSDCHIVQELNPTHIKTLVRMAQAFHTIKDYQTEVKTQMTLFSLTKEKEYFAKWLEARKLQDAPKPKDDQLKIINPK